VRAKASGYYINSILANQEVTANGYDEALLLDTEGYVSEGSGENMFMVRNGIVYTPDLASCLDGITRDSIIQIAKDLGYEVREKRITRDEVYSADEAFQAHSIALKLFLSVPRTLPDQTVVYYLSNELIVLSICFIGFIVATGLLAPCILFVIVALLKIFILFVV
jgi:hypothetical protein